MCFKEGHMARECTLEKGSTEAGNPRITEMKKNGTAIPGTDEANALRCANWTDDASTDPDELSALRAFHASHSRGQIIESDVDPNSFFCTAIDKAIEVDSKEEGLEEKVVTYAARATKGVAVLDSGATRHFCCDLDLLSDYKAYADGPKQINGVFDTLGQGLGEGTMVLICGSSRTIRLGRVMYAPKLGVNLISQTRMMLSGFRFTNTPTLLSIYSSTYLHLLDMPVSPSIEIKV
ncbi:hypothetical protein JCM16303_004054 [Sporobolomyces ruberrimus]